MLHAARSDPTALLIGVDADAASMATASRKAARPARKGGVPNALFVVAAVEALPAELAGIADDVRIHFPWGSLLRGIVRADERVVGPIAGLCAPRAALTALVSITERDRGAGVAPQLDRVELGARFARHGLDLVEMRPATRPEIAGARSSWAKRLRAGEAREVTLLRLRRGTGTRDPSTSPSGSVGSSG